SFGDRSNVRRAQKPEGASRDRRVLALMLWDPGALERSCDGDRSLSGGKKRGHGQLLENGVGNRPLRPRIERDVALSFGRFGLTDLRGTPAACVLGQPQKVDELESTRAVLKVCQRRRRYRENAPLWRRSDRGHGRTGQSVGKGLVQSPLRRCRD